MQLLLGTVMAMHVTFLVVWALVAFRTTNSLIKISKMPI